MRVIGVNFEGDLLVLLETEIKTKDPQYPCYKNYGLQPKHNN